MTKRRVWNLLENLRAIWLCLSLKLHYYYYYYYSTTVGQSAYRPVRSTFNNTKRLGKTPSFLFPRGGPASSANPDPRASLCCRRANYKPLAQIRRAVCCRLGSVSELGQAKNHECIFEAHRPRQLLSRLDDYIAASTDMYICTHIYIYLYIYIYIYIYKSYQ